MVSDLVFGGGVVVTPRSFTLLTLSTSDETTSAGLLTEVSDSRCVVGENGSRYRGTDLLRLLDSEGSERVV